MIEDLKKLDNNVLNQIIMEVIKLDKKEYKADIVNFNFVKQLFINEYSLLCITFPEETYEMIVFDLLSYLNNENDFCSYSGVDFDPQFYSFWKRNPKLNTKTNIEINEYFRKIFKRKHITTQFNILLGLMLPDERMQSLFLCLLRYFKDLF